MPIVEASRRVSALIRRAALRDNPERAGVLQHFTGPVVVESCLKIYADC